MNHNNSIRAFIAIPIPQDIREYIGKIIENFQRELPENSIKWVQPDNIHLTLQFLGDISNSTLNDLVEKLEDDKFFSFNLEITQIGAFPSIFKPRVVWIGVSKSERLNNVALYIQNLTRSLQIETDNKPFSPHFTIARIKPGIKENTLDSLKKLLIKSREIERILFNVNNYCLYQSKLTPNGPIYSVLQSYNLISK